VGAALILGIAHEDSGRLSRPNGTETNDAP